MTVSIVIEKGTPGTHRFRHISLTGCTGEVLKFDTRQFGDIGKLDISFHTNTQTDEDTQAQKGRHGVFFVVCWQTLGFVKFNRCSSHILDLFYQRLTLIIFHACELLGDVNFLLHLLSIVWTGDQCAHG